MPTAAPGHGQSLGHRHRRGRGRLDQWAFLGCHRDEWRGVFHLQRWRRDHVRVDGPDRRDHRQRPGYDLDHRQLPLLGQLGHVQVTPSNGSCNGTAANLSVTVTGVGAAGSISGPTTVCAGQTGTGYSISSVGGATTYTWTAPTGATVASGQGSTSILVNWGTIAGNVTVTPANANACTGGGPSLPVAVNAAPSITSGPSPQAVCVDGSASFAVSASGAGLSYQWQKNGSNIGDGGTIGGSGTTSLTISNAAIGDSGASFDCVVSGTCSPPATSGAATLTVNASPATFNVTGGGLYCAASGGATVGLDGSESSADYQLEVNGNPPPCAGCGHGQRDIVHRPDGSGHVHGDRVQHDQRVHSDDERQRQRTPVGSVYVLGTDLRHHQLRGL